MGSQSGHHHHGKHPPLAYDSPPGTAWTHNKSRESESQVPKPNYSTETPQLVVHSPSSSGSERAVNAILDSTPESRQQRYKAPSSIDSPRESLGDVDDLLLKSCYKHADGTGKPFWTLPILKGIVTSQNVFRALGSCGIQGHKAEEIAKVILQAPKPRRSSYIKVFGILELCDKTASIEAFLCPENGVCDSDLPLLAISTDNGMQLQKRNQKGELPCFKRWKPGHIDNFRGRQYEFCPHIFGISDKTKAPHFVLGPEIILPFTSPGEELRSSLPSDERIGAFGEVVKHCIPPGCHGFDEILAELHLEERRVFAVKKLHRGNVNDLELAKHETDQLKRFNGHISPHIVTLLATFIQSGEYYFVFPFAEGDLCMYWETHSPPQRMDSAFARWYAVQLSGLIDAISSIHYPNLLRPEPKFGRHGDIKPDNILWFRSSRHAQGLFVISDLGLSALHSDKSRSNIPGQNVPPVPGYRPPECDIEKAMVSRLFDMWTMGCLYLEMITWYLGGEELRVEFEGKRTTSFLITGALTNQFYNLGDSDEGGGMFVQFIKPEVTNWINQLRGHPACTDFVHEIIDIIEGRMIVILADPPKRAKSIELKPLFRGVCEKCDRSESYCEVPNPRPRPKPLEDAKEGVCVNLNERVKHQMSNNITPRVFKGAAKRSVRPEQMEV